MSTSDRVRVVLEKFAAKPLLVSGEELEGLARSIAVAAGMGLHNEQPRARQTSHKTMLAELSKLSELCIKLHEHLACGMHRNSLEAISEKPFGRMKMPRPYHGQLAEDLLAMHLAAEEAKAEAMGDPEEPLANEGPVKAAAQFATSSAMKIYQRITGVEPTRIWANGAYGHAHDYLTEIFGALDIDAKADSQMRLWKNRRQKTA